MLKRLTRRSISGFIFSLILLSSFKATAQDTLRTFGPRLGIDMARFAYLFADPRQKGTALSLDFEVYKNIYPALELGFNSTAFERETFSYASRGFFGRIGLDYNLLPVKDRSVHHIIYAGTRYGTGLFSHRAEHIITPDNYWGDYVRDEYRNNLTGHWLELNAGIRTEVADNFFMGWTVRYMFLISAGKDEIMTPYLVPGYGRADFNRSAGISYWIMYRIPLIKK
ncbi:MAG: hypothetical protein JXR52_08915 [Bacteroidales bacterium]|nr:hypothetical protein [Bacteroidales bacterium]